MTADFPFTRIKSYSAITIKARYSCLQCDVEFVRRKYARGKQPKYCSTKCGTLWRKLKGTTND